MKNKHRYKSWREGISANITEWRGPSKSWLSNCFICIDIEVHNKTSVVVLEMSLWVQLEPDEGEAKYILGAVTKWKCAKKLFLNWLKDLKERVAQTNQGKERTEPELQCARLLSKTKYHWRLLKLGSVKEQLQFLIKQPAMPKSRISLWFPTPLQRISPCSAPCARCAPRLPFHPPLTPEIASSEAWQCHEGDYWKERTDCPSGENPYGQKKMTYIHIFCFQRKK